ncbi:TonB-dependent receptor [Hymenobacter ruricola]|uniref:TonB-dependent receptor n=1 Tax=Hymenobacter ruricola TaxID=2791023 RepID=A0ABS0I551_9BACT|nr:TonB-dependent receptor [Hymenobacter ruricola]MBF9222019.1 TonB-dependent receptor [Hymenobacter ruricola]
MKHFVTALFAVLLSLPALAQTTFSIRGRVLDKVTGETLPGATVQVSGNGQNTGSGADADGGYKIPNLPAGTYTVQASFIGYKPLTQTVKITTQSVVATFTLNSDNASLEEVTVVAAQAQERSTPVAFSAVNEVKLRETLSNRDLPMILNETPGVYATQGGGGTGDSRINVRGFDQRNVAVLINGVPVNDMETGQVYWSNWDLGDVTKSLQVQRGLSAAKISVPSVGGSINVLTRGFDDKKAALARVETGSNNYFKSSLMLSTGQMKGDWAVTVFGSRRRQDGWVDKTFDDAWTYFGNISKRIGHHSFSLTALGSPQSHGQRTFASRVGIYSNEKAAELGAIPIANGNLGFRYNPNWGVLNRYTLDGNGQRQYKGEEVVNERVNYYNKPQISLNHVWNASDKLFISTVLYGSRGEGGGSGTAGSSGTLPVNTATQQQDFQRVFDNNFANVKANGERLSSQYLVNSVNSHRWYGFITGADYLLTPQLTLSAGLDGRSYYGLHYREIRDLLGGTYTTSTADRNANPNTLLREGDKIGYNYDGKTQWLGGYGQLEYKTPLLSAVLSGTVSQIRYKRIDYFQPKLIGQAGNFDWNDHVVKPADKFLETEWADFTGYSVKAGANYNFTEHDNLFANIGYNSKVPFFNSVYDPSGIRYRDVKNEGISSFEVGYGINYPGLKATLNAYYTYWSNKSSNSTGRDPDGNLVYNNVRNVDARHVGVELAVAQEISRSLQLNAAISIGDWRWAGKGLLTQVNESNQVVGDNLDVPIYLSGVHVGDAAQNQFQLGLRYEPVRGLYVRPSFLLFTKYYAGFDPLSLREQVSSFDSYRVPTSRNLDLHLGYDLPNRFFNDKVKLGVKGSLLNVLNEFYITDVPARSGVNYTNPGLLEAFYNRGRTFTVGLSATL